MTMIKKVLSAAILMGLANTALADSTAPSTSIDQDPYTKLCIAALKSEQAFLDTARELNVSKAERDRLVCNDLTVEEFASEYRLTEQNTIATVQ